MSYDVDVVIDACDHCGRGPSYYGDHNYTYNVSPMFAKAFGGDGLREIEGETASRAAGLISIALGSMQAKPKEYRALNPSNGWGDFDGAMNFLRDIRKTCANHPDGKVRIT